MMTVDIVVHDACMSCAVQLQPNSNIYLIGCWSCWPRRLPATMENASSMTSDVWNDVTTSPSLSDQMMSNLGNIRDLALKVIWPCSQGHLHSHRNSRCSWQFVRPHHLYLVHQDHWQGISQLHMHRPAADCTDKHNKSKSNFQSKYLNNPTSMIFGYRRDFIYSSLSTKKFAYYNNNRRENQRTLCNFSTWTAADVGVYRKAVLWQRNHTMPL